MHKAVRGNLVQITVRGQAQFWFGAESFQPTMKIQRNENDQLSEMPELRLPAVMHWRFRK